MPDRLPSVVQSLGIPTAKFDRVLEVEVAYVGLLVLANVLRSGEKAARKVWNRKSEVEEETLCKMENKSRSHARMLKPELFLPQDISTFGGSKELRNPENQTRNRAAREGRCMYANTLCELCVESFQP